MKSFNAIEYLVRSSVPKDTLAIRKGFPELYETLGWDTQCHVRDWGDKNVNVVRCI